jgi:hypothetical protein
LPPKVPAVPVPPKKSLDQKLERIRNNPACKDFILADAKDGDMGLGLAAPGKNPGGSPAFRSLAQYRDFMREITRQGLVDIMLMSASASEQLTIDERLFDQSTVTPAVRANDTTDIWLAQTADYAKEPSLPFATTTIDHIQCGHHGCKPDERRRGADLALYSVTLNNDAQRDTRSLDQYKAFRLEAEAKGLRHFLEVFAPNAPVQPIDDVGRFVNDSIARAMGGVTKSGRPIFLKMPYFGPAAMEALFHYDPTLVIGILGGSAGTTLDAFHLLADAKKHGARAALFGRKINQAEDQLLFIRHLRDVADDQLTAEEAVRSYHGELEKAGLKPHRPLVDDLVLTSS